MANEMEKVKEKKTLLLDEEKAEPRENIMKKYMTDEEWYRRVEEITYAQYSQAKEVKESQEAYLKNEARKDHLNKYLGDDEWYKRAEKYTSQNFDRNHAKYMAKQEKKKAKEPTKMGKKISGWMAWFGEDGLTDWFFFLFNVVLAVWNFYSLKGQLTLWYGSMGVYYLLLGFLRFWMLQPKPRFLRAVHPGDFWIRKVSSWVFYLIGTILPFILFFSLTFFNHTKNNGVLIVVFLLYTFFKISALLSKFVTSAMRDISAFTPLSCINHVELIMAILTMERYWLGICQEDMYGRVLVVNIISGILAIVAVIFLGVYSSLQAKELKRILDLHRWHKQEIRDRVHQHRVAKKQKNSQEEEPVLQTITSPE